LLLDFDLLAFKLEFFRNTYCLTVAAFENPCLHDATPHVYAMDSTVNAEQGCEANALCNQDTRTVESDKNLPPKERRSWRSEKKSAGKTKARRRNTL
jgi:hypothetical protein